MKGDIKALSDSIFLAVKGYVGVEFDRRLKTAIEPLLARFAEIPAGKDGKDGADGLNGLGAFEVAKACGFDGDQAAWLKSLRGESVKGEPGEKGMDGKDGSDGRDADPAVIDAAVQRAVALLPKAVDGKDADAAEIAKDVLIEVSKFLDEIPIPKDGINGADGKSAYELAVANGFVGTEPEWLDSLVGPPGADGCDGEGPDPEELAAMVQASVAEAVAAMPKPKDGANGKDADPAEIAKDVLAEVSKFLDEIPVPKDGRDGESVDPAVIIDLVAKAVDQIPRPRDGVDGKDGANGADGKDVSVQMVAEIVAAHVKSLPPAEPGAPGKDVDPAVVAELVAKAVAEIPTPKDGRDGKDGEKGADADPAVIRLMVARAAQDMPAPRDGKDGAPGRDALHITILPAIDETRSYARGTFAKHRGGLMTAIRTTDPITAGVEESGWDIILDPVVKTVFVQSETDPRSFEFKSITAFGKTAAAESFNIPVPLYKGVFREGEEYLPGDQVTWAGSMHHCKTRTREKPLTADWQLIVKKGSDGRDGKDGDRGEKGERGLPGQDRRYT
jgi:hypothetical protein